MEMDIVLTRSDEYLHHEVDNEIVMMNINSGLYISLNETGKSIWLILEEPKSLDEIMENLAVEYNVTAEQLKKDTVPFIEKLVEKKIIVKA
jgi:hypothetical protein